MSPAFLWLAATAGALSLLTPCVFPMVPITISYFLAHAAEGRSRSWALAAIFALGIIGAFTALGLAFAALFGAAGLARFAADPWVNLALAGAFVGFALNLFGAYTIALPPGLLNRLDRATRRGGGWIEPLLMGAVFTVTSFTCTAPFVGTLLVLASRGERAMPLIGMLVYSTVFALPFVLLALLPGWIGRLPRGGAWLNSTKAFLGFAELTAATKFLSNADLVWGWGIFTRPSVLVIWASLAALAGLHAAGLLRLGHPVQARLTPVRAAIGAACLAVALGLAGGAAGGRTGPLESYLPQSPTGDGGTELHWILNDLAAARARARAEKRALFIDFTGYTCTNCRWMETNIFPVPGVRRQLSRFVLARLFTDGEGALYERQQAFQEQHFGTVALPLYAVLDPSGRTRATFLGSTRDAAAFAAFLRRAAD